MMTRDDKRNGTATRFAALDVLDGAGVGQTMQRQRHQEFRRIPAGKAVPVIQGNHCPDKHSKVREWLDRHPHRTCHFIPTASSGLNAVEGGFAKLTGRRSKHGMFGSLDDVKSAITRFIARHNNTASHAIDLARRPG